MGKSIRGNHINIQQASFPGMCPIENAVETFSESSIEERGAIYTRREVVEFILDLVGYISEQPLYDCILLEPSFGGGDFLLIAIERLLDSCCLNSEKISFEKLSKCIRAVELHQSSFKAVRAKVLSKLINKGVEKKEAEKLVDKWLIKGDFLLTHFPLKFDYVIGNPPYIRQEQIPDALVFEYRARYQTVYDRADIYIPFIEHSLELLSEKGVLGFICADRWMKNRYGGPLRKMVADKYHLKIYIDMVDTQAFHSEVVAYPAITIITRDQLGPTRITRRPEISKSVLSVLSHDLLSKKRPHQDSSVKELSHIANGDHPWIFEESAQIELVRRLESEFPTIEESSCKVGIGVATGADKAFIGRYDELNVEDDRKLPIVMTRDIVSGNVEWRGFGIINPFTKKGGIVNLVDYPLLKRYLEERKEQITKRHVAKKNPRYWYRTIDRIHPHLASKPKLLIPDIKGKSHIVYEDGQLYPHHNLYYITSEEWDLVALQGVLMSGIASIFVSTYSTKMRGGYMRFQAQYLRRIRLPKWSDVSNGTKNKLVDAANSKDIISCNQAVCSLYGLSNNEFNILVGS